MNDHELHELLSDAVSDIEPEHRLNEIQARTARPDRRSRWYVAGGTVLATAAAVTTFAVVANPGDDDTAPDPAPDPTEVVETRAVPAYYIGETPQGPRLFREFAAVDATVPKLEASLGLIENGPADPDYTTAWGPDSFEGAHTDGPDDVIYVELADESLHDRPAGMSAEEADLAIAQVIYTVQGALGDGRTPVQFQLNGNPIDQVYGEQTNEPLGNQPRFDVFAPVNISDPTEGQTVTGSFIAKGVADSFEATVPWEIRDADDNLVQDGFATAEGWDGLYAWETEIDVSDLEPGNYTFVAMTSDPSGGAEGAGPTSDTRTVVVE